MPNLTPEERWKIVGDYKHGSVKRIKLKNFLTYFNAEVSPGPRLNMVIGPNGTGKSTILCAMCLGLGGEPRLLGRASAVETFIANGEDEGSIEIELVNENGENPIIRRELFRNSSPKSMFFWNDEQTTAKAVKEKCLEKYEITVDNLCTFLPQDKVGNFSGFDSKQLLIETEKAMTSSQKHYHTHMSLIKQQEEMRGGDNQKETLEERLLHLEHESKRLERTKDLIEERNMAVHQAELLKKKILWLEFDAQIEIATAKNNAVAELKEKVSELKTRVRPLQEAYECAAENAHKYTSDFKKYEAEIRAHYADMDKQQKKYQNHDDKIENLKGDILQLEAERDSLRQKVEQAQSRVEDLKAKTKEYPPLEDCEEEERQLREDNKDAFNKHKKATKDFQHLKHVISGVEDEYNRVATKMARLQDEKARRRDRIFRQEPNLKKAHDWLHQNRAQFRKEIVGPVVCEITPKSVGAAASLEAHVRNATLKSFIVQCKEDYDLLYHNIREKQNIPINIAIVDRFKPVTRIYSSEKMEVLKSRYGVLGFLDEAIEAPDLVMEALKNAGQIDKVLVGSDKTQECIDNQGLLEFLSQPEGGQNKLQSSVIFASKREQSFKYQTIVSKYSGKTSTRIDNIRPAKWLAPGVSNEQRERQQAEFDSIAKQLEEKKPAIMQAEEEMRQTEKAAQDIKASYMKARDNLRLIQKMLEKIKTAERALQQYQQDLELDDSAKKNELKSELNKRVAASLNAIEMHAESYKKMMKATVKHTGIRLNQEFAVSEEQRLREQLHEASEELRTADEAKKRAQAELKMLKSELKRLKKEASREAPIEDENKEDLPLKAELEALGVETLQEAVAALEDAQQKIDNIEADDNAVRAYEENKRIKEEVEELLKDLQAAGERRKAELSEQLQDWETQLAQAVSKVNALFAKYMAEMGCMGEVALTKGESTPEMPHGNFKDWGIEIRVSFRGNTNLQVLSARVQSGGERSVSTIMYLMALQDLMVSPFRCVDEINQGLDERNERLVFKRIVMNSTRRPGIGGSTDHTGQYFLITPKLLPNLYDMEVEAMTVLFIFNGPFNVKNPGDFDISKLLSLRKRRIIKTDAADDEENTPNSQSSETRPSKRGRRSLTTKREIENV